MIHFIAWVVHWYVWLIIVLCKAEWWVLHCRPLLTAAICWDLSGGTAGQLLRREWWYARMPEPAGE